MRSRYNNDPREITARFNSVCKETGKPIKKGDTAIYYPAGKSVYHVDSRQAEEFYTWQADLSMGWDY
jgi:hypothetical protein